MAPNISVAQLQQALPSPPAGAQESIIDITTVILFGIGAAVIVGAAVYMWKVKRGKSKGGASGDVKKES